MGDSSGKISYFIVSNEDIASKEDSQSATVENKLINGTTKEKIKALKTLIRMINNDENYPRMIMSVLKFAQMVEDHSLKKLCLLYWEVVEKTNADGTTKGEITLACNALRQDLLSPNEFIRGRTLRLISKIMVPDILENLINAINDNISHRHFYVRRNALMCLYAIYQHFGPELLENSANDIYQQLLNENDISTKRNAFIVLFCIDQEEAINYLKTVLQGSEDSISELGDIFLLSVIEVLRKMCRGDPTQKPRLMNAIFIIAQSNSPSVLYETANSITQLTSSPSAIKVALQAYLTLLSEQNDNNVKLIVINKIIELKDRYSKLLQDCIVEILSVVKNSSSHEIRRRALDLATDLINLQNKSDVISFLEKEIRFASKDLDEKEKSTHEYRKFIIQKVNDLTIQFPDTIPSILQALLSNFLCLSQSKLEDSALESAIFVREVMESHGEFRKDVADSIRNNLFEIRSSKALRVLLWCLGEYSESGEDLTKSFDTIMENIGSIPLTSSAKERELLKQNKTTQSQVEEETKERTITKTVILPDGSYGTETVVIDDKTKSNRVDLHNEHETKFPLREFIEGEEFFLCGILGLSMLKIILKTKKKMQKSFKKMAVDTLIFLCSYLRIHQENKKFDPDNKSRISLCMKILSNLGKTPVNVIDKVISGEGRKILSSIINKKIERIEQKKQRKIEKSQQSVSVQPDELIFYRQLRNEEAGEADFEYELGAADLTEASDLDFLTPKSNSVGGEIRTYQLTGLSDDIYVEGRLEIHQYDLILTLLLVNRTKNTLPSVNVTLLTLGSIKIVEKPITVNLKGYSSEVVKAVMKVFNTENGGVYGYVNYEGTNPVSIPLDGIEIDFMDSLTPGYCTEAEFKKMWSDYEWENKIIVQTTITDIVEYIETLQQKLNANRLTPLNGKDSGFLVTTFYAKSKFDEDALLNVSIEKTKEGKINGLIRIRAKTEGMAGCIGNRIKQLQKKI
jgi:coatomer subunit beta